jgi:hypothetical protein
MTNRLMLLRETVAVYWENHTEHINTLRGQDVEIFMLKQLVLIVTVKLYNENKNKCHVHSYRF